MNVQSFTQRESELIEGVFHAHPKIAGVILFGSRAKGTHRPQSDVDLALLGNLKPLEAEEIASELDELPLPYRFDVVVFDLIRHPPLREHIERVGIPLYPDAVALKS